MSDTKQQAASSGIGLDGLLFIVFVAAKLWDKIDWPWVWVCSPLWIPFAAIVAGVLVYFVFGLIVISVKHAGRWLGKHF